MSKNRITASIVLVVATASLSGCADYLNHYDTVTLEAGNAQKHNQLLHTTDPFNPASGAVTIETSGTRAADTAKEYEDAQKPGAKPQSNITINVTQ